ncbi:MAG: hypothetical protein JNM27_07835 [Leptospirales bacterium]|nr:hypothetical protein [Leptospirales bacterium]
MNCDSVGFPAAGVKLAPVLGNNSQFAAFHPDGSFIYAGRDPASGGGIQKYSVTAGTGAMADLGNTLINGTDTVTSASFPFGGSPLVATTSTGDVLTMSKDGAGNLSNIQRTATGGPFAIGVVSANENYFYVVTTAPMLQTYSLTSGGVMTLIDQTSPMLGGAISFSMCRDMSGRFLFVNEFTGPNSETHVFRTDGDGLPRFAGSYLMGDQIRACVASTDQPWPRSPTSRVATRQRRFLLRPRCTRRAASPRPEARDAAPKGDVHTGSAGQQTA